MVETVGFRQEMWFVMLESAKDRVLEDTTCSVWNGLLTN
jgi:hypothetical protein